MYTKADFQKVIADSVERYPTVAARYKAGDPAIIQHMDAMATMLAMVSQQIEVAQTEVFEKTRDSTVLADAAMRGIIRKGTAARAKLAIVNSGVEAVTVESGRSVLDARGRHWVIETAATVAGGETGYCTAVQCDVVTVEHTVADSEPFYAAKIPESEDGSYLCAVGVADGEGEYKYRERYVNAVAGERIFHLEVDDRQNVYARFGREGVIGTQPTQGTVLTLTITYTQGAIENDYGEPFAFQYTQSALEGNLALSFEELLEVGQDPISIAQLRDLAKYPSVYQTGAVFLGEFDFLVRRNYPSLKFLSVWNETIEEQARGASLDNINCIFVACLSATGEERVLIDTAENDRVPEEIEEAEWTDTQKAIARTIAVADDSYRVRFYTPVRSPIKITIRATVSTSFVASDVKEKIIEVMLANFGEETAAAQHGYMNPLYRKIYELLRQGVTALTSGDADLTVAIAEDLNPAVRPELWRYVDRDSLDVEVKTANIVMPTWGGAARGW